MKTIEKAKTYNADPENVFACLDDLGVTGMHMTQSSMPMMGGKMNVHFLSKNKQGPHAKYGWTGKVLWMAMELTVVVTQWVKGKEKTWETTGAAKMIIYSWFPMHLKVEGNNRQTTANLSISYEKPEGLFNRTLSFLLADWYCR